jgi:hypothetical protein
MTKVATRQLMCGVVVLLALGISRPARAQLGLGTWVKTSDAGEGRLTMTVEPCCHGGFRLAYRINGRGEPLMTIDSAMDGSEAPVLAGGKPTGETMAIKRIDERHTVTVLKMNGKMFGTSRSALSADGKTLTVENEITSASAPGQAVGKQTEIWVKK